MWLSKGMRNAEIRGLTWDCIRWEEGEVMVCKSLRRDGYSSGHHSWATTKTVRERVVPLTHQVLEVLRQYKEQMEQLGIHDPYGLVSVSPANQHLRPFGGSCVAPKPAALWIEAPLPLRPTP